MVDVAVNDYGYYLHFSVSGFSGFAYFVLSALAFEDLCNFKDVALGLIILQCSFKHLNFFNFWNQAYCWAL